MIDYKFLYFKTNSAFQEALNAMLINDRSIVFVESPNKFIYTHGVKYPCELSIDSSSDLLEELEEFKEHWTHDLADAIARLLRNIDDFKNNFTIDEGLLAWILSKINELSPDNIQLHLLNGESLLEKDITIPVLSAGKGIEISGDLINIRPATSTQLGGIKTGFESNGNNYKVLLDSQGNAFVNVSQTKQNEHVISLTNDTMPVGLSTSDVADNYTNSCNVEVRYGGVAQTATNEIPQLNSGKFKIVIGTITRSDEEDVTGITAEIDSSDLSKINVSLNNVENFAGVCAYIPIQVMLDNADVRNYIITVYGVSAGLTGQNGFSIDLYTSTKIIKEDYEETVTYPEILYVGVKMGEDLNLVTSSPDEYTFDYYYDQNNTSLISLTDDGITLETGHQSITIRMYYSGLLMDSLTIPYVKDGMPGVSGASAINYYINVLLNNMVIDSDTNAVSGNISFKVLKRQGSTVTEMTDSSGIWLASDNERLEVKMLNTARTFSYSNGMYTSEILLSENESYAGSYGFAAVTLVSSTLLSLASVVIPFTIKGSTGTAGNVQSLLRTVVRMHDSYDNSTTYYAGAIADANGIMYMDIVLGSDGCYYRVTRSAGSTVGNPIFDSVTGDLNSTYWSRFSVQDDTYINTLIAEHIAATDITAKQIVITSGTGVNTTVVGGLLGDVTTAQDFQQAAEDENVSNTNNELNPVRLFVGNVQAGGDVSTAAFNVRHDGTVYAAGGNAIFRSDGTLIINGIIKPDAATSAFSIDAIYRVIVGANADGTAKWTNVYYYSIIKNGFLVKRGSFETTQGVTTTTKIAHQTDPSIPYIYAGTQNDSATYYNTPSATVGVTALKIKGWTTYRNIVTKKTIMDLIAGMSAATYNQVFGDGDGGYIFENGESIALMCNNEKYVQDAASAWKDEHGNYISDLFITEYVENSNPTIYSQYYLNNSSLNDLIDEITERLLNTGQFEVLPRLRFRGNEYEASDWQDGLLDYMDGRTTASDVNVTINGRSQALYYLDYITYTTTTLTNNNYNDHTHVYTSEDTFNLYCISPNPGDPATAEYDYYFGDDTEAFEKIGWTKTPHSIMTSVTVDGQTYNTVHQTPEYIYADTSASLYTSEPLGQFLGDNVVTWSNS